MSSHSKNRSYRKIDNVHVFPEDFFSTLNISDIKNGPKMTRVICRQIKKNDKNLSRICKRERSLDIGESYMLSTPEVGNKYESVRFPKISSNKGANYSMATDQSFNDSELCYESQFRDRYDTSRRRMHRYMKSEDRLRKHKSHLLNGNNCFKINIRDNLGLYNSPVRKPSDSPENKDDRYNSTKIVNPNFTIRPFNLECSTATTTSHSTRRHESPEKAGEKSEDGDYLKFTTNNIQELCSKDNTPKIIAPLRNSPQKEK